MAAQNFEDLTPEEQKKVRDLGEQLSLVPMTYAVPIYFGGPPGSDEFARLNNGSGSLILVGEKQFCITNAHVLDLYRKRRRQEKEITFQVSNIQLDPEDVLLSECSKYDLAVLDFSGWNPQEIGSDGEVPTQYLKANCWPPDVPKQGDFVMFGGYPGCWRKAIGPAEVRFDTLSSGATEILDANHERIVCQLQVDKCLVHRATPDRDKIEELGGLSGGPVLRESRTKSGLTTFEFVGVIYEYGKEFDCLFIRPASLITENGEIAGPN